MRRSQVWNTFTNLKPSRILPPSIVVAIDSICLEMGVKKSNVMKKILQDELRQYLKHKINQQNK